MRVAMIARADNRGLGLQTWEFYRHLAPAKTLVVDMGPLTPFRQHFDRYPDGEVYPLWNSKLPDRAIEWLLRDVDVLYTAETPYDYRVLERARESGVKTVVQGNFEFMRWGVEPELPRPDLWLAPSTWCLDRWPDPTVYLPFPVARDRCRWRLRRQARRFLHVAGHRAHLDRNGTRIVLEAASRVRSEVEVVVRSMDRVGGNGAARLRTVQEEVRDYWTLYDGFDVLVLPRRYGGQCLPINEALSCGLPVITLDVEPQRSFLPRESLVEAGRRRSFPGQPGPIEYYGGFSKALARRIDEFAEAPALVERLSKEADVWAEAHSWEALEPEYRKVFASLL